ncbi:hypothetical protein L7815_023335, partial [Serratia marcescens]|uniref:hypothetical protein n=1 Tax=Serratia marcescens TaxID=615 RepID=UPI001EE773FC
MPVFEAKVFILDFFHLFDIIGFHTIKFRFPVVVRVHQFTSSPVHQFTSSPVHQFTSSPVHQFTSSPVHQFTSSPVH